RDIALDAGVLASDPEALTLTLSAGMTATRAITLSNSGGFTASFTMQEINAPFTPVTVSGPFAGTARRVSPKHLHDLNAATVREYDPPDVPLLVAGTVITTWDSALAAPWGVAYDTDTGVLWLSDTRLGGGEDRNVAFQPDGAPTGASLATSPWVTAFAADIAYNPVTGKLWQVNVGGDNCIYELDPAIQTTTGRMLCPPFGVSERGLAYDPTTDTFYSGSWDDQILYHFDATGRLLDSSDLKLNIAGLAYNPATHHLFVMSSAEVGHDVYVLDVDDAYAIIGGFDIDGLGGLEQAGLSLDRDGNLWTVNQVTGQVIQAISGETGVCAWEEISWLTTDPVSGTVGIGAEQGVNLTIDASGMDAGVYPVHVRVANDTPYGELNVPITLTVVQTYDVLLAPTVAAQSGLPGTPVTYTFTVTNTGLETDTFTATLSGGLWETSGTQMVGPLASGASAPVTVAVSIPLDAACAATDNVTLTVTSQGDSARAASAAITTSALPVYGAQVSAVPDWLAGDPGEALQTSLWVTNTGNCVDTFALAATGAWPVDVLATTGALDAGAGSTLPVTVTVPGDALAGDESVTMLTATSQGDGGIVIAVPVTATADAVYDVALSPQVSVGVGEPGGTAIYTLTVSNTGNATDTYTLTTDGAAWPTTLVPQTTSLAPGEALTVTATVSVPVVVTTSLDTARVIAAGTGVTATSVLTTTLECVAVDGAGFSYTPMQPLTGQMVTFTGTAMTGTLPIAYTWDFGDGGTAVGKVVTHTFSAGTAILPYTVVMTATNTCGFDETEQVIRVHPHQIYLPLVVRTSG
ncbi:MAG: PKD domain-containing protein, partial [Anaerolineae bacterium]